MSSIRIDRVDVESSSADNPVRAAAATDLRHHTQTDGDSNKTQVSSHTLKTGGRT